MRKRIVFVVALQALLLGTTMLHAQPAVPAVPAVPPAASGWLGLFQAIAGKIKACKAKMCNDCPLGMLITNMLKPLNMALGGLICPPCCPPVNPDDLKKASDIPAGACAKIMTEEMGIPKRLKAVRCLAHTDCHWWPEVEDALIGALRTDPADCVRLEAAMALNNGCCCSKKTMEALLIVITGSKKDGNPSENSERVKSMSMQALQRCLTSFVDEEQPRSPEIPRVPLPPEKPAPRVDVDNEPPNLAYYKKLEQVPTAQIVADARRAMVAVQAAPKVETAIAGPSGNRSIFQVWASAQHQATERNTAPLITPAPPRAPLATAPPPRLVPISPPAAATVAAPGPKVELSFQE